LESGEFHKVGVNCYVDEDEEAPDVELHPYAEKDAEAQIISLQQVRKTRDNNRVENVLTRLKNDAQDDKNVVPALIEAVKAYATVGEMTNVMIEVFGRYQEPIRF
jgi:methylmalonyl-CoA mutase N-terminal domain/subunit